jgi:hypothetical protein
MLTEKFDSLNSIISSDIAKILSYFNGLNKDRTATEILAQRIVAELPVKLDALCHSLGKTTISYLDADARESISLWKAQNKNRFYEAELSGKIFHAVAASSFSLKSYVVFRHLVFTVIVAASGIALSVAPISAVILSALTIPATAIKMLALVTVAGVTYLVVPKMTENHEKSHVLKQVSDYLSDIQLELNKQIYVIKATYSKEFNSLALALGEK